MGKEQYILPQKSEATAANARVILSGLGLQAIKPQFFNIKEVESDPIIAISYLGTPVFSNVVFQSGSYTDNGKTIDYPELTINTVLIDVSLPKNIVKTVIQGRNGTVKEYVSDGDYEITMRGAIVSQNGEQFPREDFDRLHRISKVKQAISVTSTFLQLFSIHSLVIEDVSWGQREGFINEQMFQIKAISDDPIELKIKNA